MLAVPQNESVRASRISEIDKLWPHWPGAEAAAMGREPIAPPMVEEIEAKMVNIDLQLLQAERARHRLPPRRFLEAPTSLGAK